MRIRIVYGYLFPQVSGVATSIRTLKTQLEKMGHNVFILLRLIEMLIAMKTGRLFVFLVCPSLLLRIVEWLIVAFSKALEIAKQYKLDIIHTQTEFSLGLLGIAIAHELKIPVVHTYHTQYEDYVRYIAKGMVIRPSMVKYIVRGFMSDFGWGYLPE